MTTYAYIGPEELRKITHDAPRTYVASGDDVLNWISKNHQPLTKAYAITATFIIDLSEHLWIADRHSEHVSCAVGQDILAAGEMTFGVDQGRVEVVGVTNQSTGYCPGPESWLAVLKPWTGRTFPVLPTGPRRSFFGSVQRVAVSTSSKMTSLSALFARNLSAGTAGWRNERVDWELR